MRRPIGGALLLVQLACAVAFAGPPATAGPALTGSASEVALVAWWDPAGDRGTFTFVAAVRSIDGAGVSTRVVYGRGVCDAVGGEPQSCRLRPRVKSLDPLAFEMDLARGAAQVSFRANGRRNTVRWSGGAWHDPEVHRGTGIRAGTAKVWVAADLGAGITRSAVASGNVLGSRLRAGTVELGAMGAGAGGVAIICAGLQPGCLVDPAPA